MLKIKSKYKIAKRLGNAIFEQTQTQKFALSEARSRKERRGGRGGSDYNRQLLEKQRIRFTYGISERQLSNYAKSSMGSEEPSNTIHQALEMRLDSVMYRLGIAPTRRAARQLVSHGHALVNGVRTKIPSYKLSVGDKISIREGSRKSPLFASKGDENPDIRKAPRWLSYDAGTLTAEVKGMPEYRQEETMLDYPALFEFYSR